MPEFGFLTTVYWLAALAMVVALLTGLIVNNKAQRQWELKVVGRCLLNAPLVLQGVWVVMLTIRVAISLLLDLWQLLQDGEITTNTALLKVLITATLLLPLNMMLLHKALNTRNPLAAGTWQLASFVLASFLLVNLALNYFYCEGISRTPAPLLHYTNNGIFCIASLPASLLLIVIAVSPQARKNALLKYGGPAVGWCVALVLAPIAIALILLLLKYTVGRLFNLDGSQAVMAQAIPLAMVALVVLLNGYTFVKALRTKAPAIIIPATLLCLLPPLLCIYYLLTLSSHNIFVTVISFIINLLALLLFAVIQAFIKDHLRKQPHSLQP